MAKTGRGLGRKMILHYEDLSHVHSLEKIVRVWTEERGDSKSLKVAFHDGGRSILAWDKGDDQIIFSHLRMNQEPKES